MLAHTMLVVGMVGAAVAITLMLVGIYSAGRDAWLVRGLILAVASAALAYIAIVVRLVTL